MKNILIIETEHEGHYLTVYIKYILRSFKNEKVKITLLTSISAKKKGAGSLQILRNENVQFDIEVINYIPKKNYSSFQLILNQFKLYYLIKKKFNNIKSHTKFDYIFVASLQKLELPLVLLGSPFGNIYFTGIYLGAKFHLKNYQLLYQSRYNYLSKIIFQRLLRIFYLKNIITNDQLFKDYIKLTNYNNHHKLVFFHDPMEFKFTFSKYVSRRKLKLPIKTKVILVYGALMLSKGIRELLSIFTNKKLDSDVIVVFAGKQNNDLRKFFYNNELVNKLKLEKKLFFFNRWINEREEAIFFDAADIVWIGYKNYPFPSGVLYQAIHKAIPTIISNDGSINLLNKKRKFGYAVRISDSNSIIRGINFIMNKKNKIKLMKNNLKFSKTIDPKKWIINFKKLHPKLYI